MPKSQLGWLNLPHSPTLPPAVSTSGQNPRDKPELGIDRYGGKDFKKRKVFKIRLENALRNVNNWSKIRA